MVHRRAFLTTLAGTAVGGLSVAAGRVDAGTMGRLAGTAGAILATPPMLWAPRADGAEFVWGVSRLARGRVELQGPGGDVVSVSTDGFGFVPQSAGVMRVRADGLRPGTEYRWRAVVEAADGEPGREESPWKPFRTLDPAAAATTFAVWNDTHEHHETIRRLHEVTPAADFLMWNGDTCNDWHEEEWLASTLLAPAGLDISAGRPLLLTFGNHDVRGKFAFRVRDHIAVPGDRPYYAFRSGPVAVVALNTGEDKPDDHPSFQGRVASQALREEQRDWLEETIVRPEFARAPYRLVFCHLPLRWLEEPEQVDYAGGGFDRYARSSRDLWHDALVRWGAQVVLSGHTHRTATIPTTADFPYAQITGGGPRMEQATWIEGRADADRMTLTVRRLHTGELAFQEEFAPLA